MSEKVHELEIYIDTHSRLGSFGYGLQQGSDEWKTRKLSTIGGSEIATLIGKNKYQTILNLIESKLGINKFAGNFAVRWGNLFEPVIAGYVEEILDTQIVGSDLFLRGAINHQTYSPDGLGIIAIDNSDPVNPKIVFSDKYLNPQYPKIKTTDSKLREKLPANSNQKIATVLFEFKCPSNRKLGGFVPDEYLPQVLTGLNSIPITDYGVYIECSIRRCAFSDIIFNTEFNKRPSNNIDEGTIPTANGFIGFYLNPVLVNSENATNEDTTSEDIKTLIAKNVQFQDILKKASRPEYITCQQFKIYDFGKMSENVLENVFIAVENKVLEVYYSAINFNNCAEEQRLKTEFATKNYPQSVQNILTDDVKREFNNAMKKQLSADIDKFAQNKNLVGVLPWKMFKCDFHLINRDPNFIYQYEKLMAEVMNVIEKCRADMANYKKYINSYFDTIEEFKGLKLYEKNEDHEFE